MNTLPIERAPSPTSTQFPYPTMAQRAAAEAPPAAPAPAQAEGPKEQQSAAADKPKRAAKPKAKKPPVDRKPRTPPLPMAFRFKIMAAINEAPATEPCAELAARINASIVDLPRPVPPSTVSAYRVELGLQPVKMPSRGELLARLAEAERQLADAKQAKLRLEPGNESPEPLFVDGGAGVKPPQDSQPAGSAEPQIAGQAPESEGGAQ